MPKIPRQVVDCFDEDDILPLRRAQAAAQVLHGIPNQYIGNKRKMVVDLWKILDEEKVEYSSVCDLFSGSAFVSIFYRLLGYDVCSNDLLTSSYCNAVAFAENDLVTIDKKDVASLIIDGPSKMDTFVSDNYAERFTEAELVILDRIRSNLIERFGDLPATLNPGYNSSNVNVYIRKYQLAMFIVTIINYVLRKCFVGGRLNSGQILARLDHRLSHAANAGQAMKFRDIKIFNIEQERQSEVWTNNMDAVECLNRGFGSHCDLVYIDPPYGGDQSDYSFMYQFSEEFIWGKSLDEIPNMKYASQFTSNKDYEDHFRSVIAAVPSESHIAISYNDSSWAGIDKISEVVKEFRSDVVVRSVDYSYNYRKDRSSSTEYVIVARS